MNRILSLEAIRIFHGPVCWDHQLLLRNTASRCLDLMPTLFRKISVLVLHQRTIQMKALHSRFKEMDSGNPFDLKGILTLYSNPCLSKFLFLCSSQWAAVYYFCSTQSDISSRLVYFVLAVLSFIVQCHRTSLTVLFTFLKLITRNPSESWFLLVFCF